MSRRLEVLLIEDREDDAILIGRALTRGGYQPNLRRVETEAAMRSALAEGGWDIILSDYILPGFGCEEALRVAREHGADIPFIALSGTVNEESILKLVKAGAGDYVMKDNLARLPSAVEREIREAENRRQRARLEVQLQQALKMEAIGRLAGGVAHDFNNLLTVITGFAQLALMHDNPEREGLEQILLAAERASGLTRQLLAFSRQQTLAPRVFDLNSLVRDMDKMLRRLIGEDIEVVSRISPDDLFVRADPGQVEQVLLNLAVNSRDAMPKGGKLTVGTARAGIDSETALVHGITAGDYCVIRVSDSGMGIPESVLPRIFEPFYTTKPEGQGTGLGLSTAYGIVRQSGGAIHAVSKAGTGTTMTVYLPAAAPSGEEAALNRRINLGAGSETILVAEDDATVLNLVSESLSARGFKVLSAANGERALEMLHELGPAGVDLLIADVVMPGMAGPLLAARATELVPRLRVLYMSGYTDEVIRHHGVSRRNSTLIQKPFAPNQLVERVRALLDGTATAGAGG